MKTLCLYLVLLTIMSAPANAALVSRNSGQAYYDTVLNITWLADAGYSRTSGYDGDGYMPWANAEAWIAALNAANHLGVNNWRLPTTPQPDPSCAGQYNPGDPYPTQGFSTGCTGSEMGHLFNVQGVSGATPSPFINVQNDLYWSGTTVEWNTPAAWGFDFGTGSQNTPSKTSFVNSWAVRDGDIGPSAPTAVDDGPIPVTAGVAAIIPVGANDTGFTDPVSVTVTAPPTKGTIGAISPTGPAAGMTITYTANIGASGADSFVYEMTDSTPASDTATVSVDISPDTDGDGIADATDNCTVVANPNQCDSDGDGFGNRCDGDLNNNNATNSQDYVLFRQQLGQPSSAPTYNKADINCNGAVNSQDYVLFRSLLGSSPGPSGPVP